MARTGMRTPRYVVALAPAEEDNAPQQRHSPVTALTPRNTGRGLLSLTRFLPAGAGLHVAIFS